MRSSCQTRALPPDTSGQGARPKRHRVAWPAEHILVFRPADKRGVKAEFGYDSRKGVGACGRGPSGLGTKDCGESRPKTCFPRCGKGGRWRYDLKPSLVTAIAKVSERVVADPLGWMQVGEALFLFRPQLRNRGKIFITGDWFLVIFEEGGTYENNNIYWYSFINNLIYGFSFTSPIANRLARDNSLICVFRHRMYKQTVHVASFRSCFYTPNITIPRCYSRA